MLDYIERSSYHLII